MIIKPICMSSQKKKKDKCKTVPVGNYKVFATPKDSNLPVHQRIKKEDKAANAQQHQQHKRSKHFIRGDANRQLNDRIAKEENNQAKTWIVGSKGGMFPVDPQALKAAKKKNS